MRLVYFLLIKDETEIKMPVTFVKSNLNLQQPPSGQNLVVVEERWPLCEVLIGNLSSVGSNADENVP